MSGIMQCMVDESASRAASGLLARLVAAWRLQLWLYEEVSTDRGANQQALMIVLLAGLSNGLGLVGRLGSAGISAGVGATLLGWPLWAGTVFLVAGLFGHRRNGRSLLRTLGFANAPGVFLALGIVPAVGALLRIAVACWLVAATVVAVQAVFQVARRRALAISLLAFVVYLLLGIISSHFAVS